MIDKEENIFSFRPSWPFNLVQTASTRATEFFSAARCNKI